MPVVVKIMKTPFFVMLYNQSGTKLIPMLDSDGNLAMYLTREEAVHAAQRTLFGEHFGYDIYEAGNDIV